MVNAQRVALKSNLIDWATLSPNLAVEMRLNQRLTLDVSAAANPFSFTIADMKASHFHFSSLLYLKIFITYLTSSKSKFYNVFPV